MFNYEHAGHCKYGTAFKKTLPKVNKLRICNSDTDSDSDCVKIGKVRRIVKGSYHLKQRDDAGHLDSSIYTDSDCDPRYSSCDTNSNEEFSNTDSDTQETVKEKKLQRDDPIMGRLHDRYAAKYGVKLRTPAPEPKKHHYGPKSKEIDTRSFDTDSRITSYDASNYGQAAGYLNSDGEVTSDDSYSLVEIYPEFGEGRTQDENRSAVDDCDSDDIAPGCNKPIQPESEDYTHPPSSESSYKPSKGTSNSSNSTNDPFSDSESLGDSSDTAIESVHVQEEACANVWFESFNDSNVWGWANIYQPAAGPYADWGTKITARFENVGEEEAGIHGFHIHEEGDLSWECLKAGGHYNPHGKRIGELQDYSALRSSWRGEADYYTWNPLVKLEGDYNVLGRSMVLHDLDGNRIACGIIKDGCSPCADGTCE